MMSRSKFLFRAICIFAVLQICVSLLRAQPEAAYLFRNTSTGASHVVKPGTYLRIWAAGELGRVRKHTGRLIRIENNQIYLKNRPAIPLDRVQKIKYRPTPLREILLAMLILSFVFLEAATIAGLAGLASEKALEAAGWLLGFGFGLFFLWLPLDIFSLRRMEQVNTGWKVEVLAPRPAAMQPVP